MHVQAISLLITEPINKFFSDLMPKKIKAKLTPILNASLAVLMTTLINLTQQQMPLNK